MYQGHRLKVKVTGAKQHDMSSRHLLLRQTWRSLATAVKSSPFHYTTTPRTGMCGLPIAYPQPASRVCGLQISDLQIDRAVCVSCLRVVCLRLKYSLVNVVSIMIIWPRENIFPKENKLTDEVQ